MADLEPIDELDTQENVADFDTEDNESIQDNESLQDSESHQTEDPEPATSPEKPDEPLEEGAEEIEDEDLVDNEDLDDAEIAELKEQMKEMEEEVDKIQKMQNEVEAEKIEKMQNEVQNQLRPATPVDNPEADTRSIYVGNVEYAVTPEELQSLFTSCGTVNRVTIVCDKYYGTPKGFAYLEFDSPEAVQNALLLNEVELRGRQLRVAPKRTNIPGMSKTSRGGGGGRGGYGPRRRGRGRRPGFRPYGGGSYYPRRRGRSFRASYF